jgi:hypothetical protein
MFQTRTQIKNRIRFLEEKVGALEQSLKLSNESNLGKCRGVFCIGCTHAVWYQHGNFSKKVIGCDVDVPCEHFSRAKRANDRTE